MTGPRWKKMGEAAIDFLDRFREEAIALRWTATDLFGVHPTVGVVRIDYCGGLMINAHRVEAIGDTWIRYGNQTFRRDRPGRPVGVPVCRCAGVGGQTIGADIRSSAVASVGRALSPMTRRAEKILESGCEALLVLGLALPNQEHLPTSDH